MRRVISPLAVLLLCAGLGRANETAEPPAVWSTGISSVASPVPSGSGEPYLSVAPDGRVLLSWIEAAATGHRLRFAWWDGAVWTEPRTAAEGPGYFVNWADVPAVRPLPDGGLVAYWLERVGEQTYAYAVRAKLSKDGGTSWTEVATPHQDGTPTEHGFVSVWPQEGGETGIVWLDGRDYAGKSDADHGSAQTALRTAALGGSATAGPETELDARVCDCCPTAAVIAGEAVVVAYRDRSAEEIRDIWLVRRSQGRWSEPYPGPKDGWKLNGCPVNGPALAAEESRVALAWFTGAGGRQRVKLAFSEDGGRTFGTPVEVDGGHPVGRVDVELLPDGAALVSWLEQMEGESGALQVRRVGRDSKPGSAVTVTTMSSKRASGYPRMVRLGNRVLFAWTEVTEGGGIRLAEATLAAAGGS